MSTAPQPAHELALSLSEFCKRAPMGRTKAYEEIRAGRLRALKLGKRTIVTVEEAHRYLDNLPRLKLPA